MSQHDDVPAFRHPVLEGGQERWVERVGQVHVRSRDQFRLAALMFASSVHEELGEDAEEPGRPALDAAFDAASKIADRTDRYPFDERIGSFAVGSAGRNIAFMLHDVWVHGPAMREWLAKRIATCPAHARWLATRPVEELRIERWDGPDPAEWPRFELVEGRTWEEWVATARNSSPWAAAVTTALVAQIESHIRGGMSFADAADRAHERVVQVDYRPRNMSMSDYVSHRTHEVAFHLYLLSDFWPRIEELRSWVRASRTAKAYGTGLYLARDDS